MERSSPRPAVSLATLVIAAFLAPLVGLFALRAVKSNRNDMSEWLPASYEETAQLEWFRSKFATDQFVVISWDGCTLGEPTNGLADDPRIERLARALREARLPERDGTPGARCFQQVTTGREALDDLTAPPANLPRKLAIERLQGTLLGPDGRQTCILATLARSTEHKLRDVVGRPLAGPWGLRKAKQTPLFKAIVQAGLRPDEVRLGGPPIDNVSIDEEGERTLARLAVLSGAFGAALAWWSLRSFRMMMVVFGCGAACAAISLALVSLTGGAVDAILMSMPALVYVLAVSGAIHFINYYRLAANEHGVDAAVNHAVEHAWKPALLCSVTTAIGLASLSTSDILPICRFGLYSAAGVLATLGVLFTMLPAVLRYWPWRPAGVVVLGEEEAEATPDNVWSRYTHGIFKRRRLVLAGSAATIFGLCLGLPRVETTIDLLKLFSPDARLVQDYQWYEEHLGRLVPMELVIRFPAETLQEDLPVDAPLAQLIHSHSFLERLDLVELVERNIRTRLGAEGDDLVGATMSAATFTRPVSDPGLGYGRTGERYVAAEELLDHRRQIADTGYLTVDPDTGEELWRVSVRVAAFHTVDHGELVARLRAAIEPIFAAERSNARALRALAAERGEPPRGSRLVLFSPEGIQTWARTSASLLAGKRVLAAGVAKKFADLQPAEIDALKNYDGVILSPGASKEDRAELVAAGARVVAAADLDLAPSDGSDVGVVYTGAVPIVYKAQRELLSSLIQSTWWSFATITPLMMFVCRSVAAGAIVMIPNTLPVLVVFGGMGWLGVPVDIGSMMAASIALGVAVDDTIHFLAWFRQDLARLRDRMLAVEAAYGRSAAPTLQAALINGLGLSVFATSSFTPTQRFGWLMLAILVAGVVAELVMLPALLFSPLGNAFRPQGLGVVRTDGSRAAGCGDDAPAA